MHTVPIPAFPRDAEGSEHPNWCDLSECTAPSALRQRGVDEADLPDYTLDNHLSTPRTIAAAYGSEGAYIVQAWRGSNQPVEDGVNGVDLVADQHARNLRIGLLVSVAQVAPLAEAFADMARLIRPTDLPGAPAENPIVEDVARSLRILGCVTRGNADALLGLTVVHLTDRERAAVLARFAGGEVR